MDVVTVVKRSPIVFPLACIAAVGMMFISEGSYWQAVGSLNQLGAMQESRASIQNLAQSILDAESGQRGYLLTGRKEYLQPYEKAVAKIGDSFLDLDRYYGDDPGSMQALKDLHGLTDTRLSELAETIRLYDEGKVQASTELVLSDIGKEKMEALRALGAGLLARETSNVAERRGELYNTLLLSRIGMAALSAISLLALFLFLRQATAAEKHEQDLKRGVQAERDRLEAEVTLRTAQLTELADHLQTAREDERNKLARIRSRLAEVSSAPSSSCRLRASLLRSSSRAVCRWSASSVSCEVRSATSASRRSRSA